MSPLTAAQLELRRAGTGGSEIAAVAGLSPYASALDVYLAKICDPAAPLVEETDEMWLGNELEPLMVRFYQRKRPGVVVEECGTIEHPTLRYILATPDRLVQLPNGERRVLEVKTAAGWRSASEWGEEETDEVPAHYLCQTQWELAVTGLDRADVLVLLHGRPRFYSVPRDNDLIDMLADANMRFWTDHVLKRVPPEPDGSQAYTDYLHRKYREARRPELLRANGDVDRWALAYRQACHLEAAGVEAKKAPRQYLEAFIGDAAGVEGPWGRITWKPRKPAPEVDWEAIALEANLPHELIEKHTTLKPASRVFRPTWHKESE